MLDGVEFKNSHMLLIEVHSFEQRLISLAYLF